ncbi:MAG: c-type cytochrome [Alphaproteobacteria bacterium]|nr:c-type cytochrome [Alphaproteobacteria bacterium]
MHILRKTAQRDAHLALCAALVFAASIVCGAARAQGMVPNTVEAQCASCHGPAGDSPSGKVPRLNGQNYAYLVQRLKGFRDITRQSPHAAYVMWDVASTIADKRIDALAAYYAAQPPTPPAPKAPLAQKGRDLFLHGAEGVPACQQCHGAEGAGAGATPRIAGQHAPYLNQALIDFSTQARVSATMNHPALRLSQSEIDELVAYLAND